MADCVGVYLCRGLASCRVIRSPSSSRITGLPAPPHDTLSLLPDCTPPPIPANPTPQAPSKWVEVEDDFVAVMVLIPTCRSNKSPSGVAPYNHLSDGKALLVLVRRCSPLQYAQFLLDLSKVGESSRREGHQG